MFEGPRGPEGGVERKRRGEAAARRADWAGGAVRGGAEMEVMKSDGEVGKK